MLECVGDGHHKVMDDIVVICLELNSFDAILRNAESIANVEESQESIFGCCVHHQ